MCGLASSHSEGCRSSVAGQQANESRCGQPQANESRQRCCSQRRVPNSPCPPLFSPPKPSAEPFGSAGPHQPNRNEGCCGITARTGTGTGAGARRKRHRRPTLQQHGHRPGSPSRQPMLLHPLCATVRFDWLTQAFSDRQKKSWRRSTRFLGGLPSVADALPPLILQVQAQRLDALAVDLAVALADARGRAAGGGGGAGGRV